MTARAQGEPNRDRKDKRWLAVFVASAGTFFAMALGVWVGGVSFAERELYGWVGQWGSPQVIALFGWINYLGKAPLLIAVMVPLLLGAHSSLRRRWWFWLLVMLVAPGVEDLSKVAVGRPRPEGLGIGFPSGHVTAAASFSILVAYFGEKSLRNRRARTVVWAVAVLVITLVAIARVLLRSHWPLDTAGGTALGVVWASAAVWWNERTLNPPLTLVD